MSNADRSDIIEEITAVLEGNGNIPQVTRDKLILRVLSVIYDDVSTVKDCVPKDLESRLKKIEAYIPWLDLGKWAVGLLGVSIVGLLWAILTHAVEIIVK